jgi:hypothetical protein
MLVADLTHFLDMPDDAPAPARALGDQLGRVVQAATSGPAGQEWASALPCTRRPGNKACPGGLLLARAGEDEPIRWRCTACADAGTISNWAGSPYDLRRRTPGAVAPSTAVVLPRETMAVLREVLLLDPDTERAVHAARARHDGRVVLQLGDEELDELLNAVAAEANHAGDRRRQKRFDEAFEVLNAAAASAGH